MISGMVYQNPWVYTVNVKKSDALFPRDDLKKNHNEQLINIFIDGNNSYAFRTINKSEIIDRMTLIFNSFHTFYNFYFIHYIYPYLLSLHIYYIYYIIILFYLLYFYH